MTDFLFECPEISNLLLFRYFRKTRHEERFDPYFPEHIRGIARSMNLCEDKKKVPTAATLKILAMLNAIHNFISGENFFRPMLRLGREEYVRHVKETLKFILVPAFAGSEEERASAVK